MTATAWLGTNKNGTETISPGKPERSYWNGGEWCYEEEVYVESETGTECLTIEIPSGSIEKLIGRKLTWDDEPVEIK